MIDGKVAFIGTDCSLPPRLQLMLPTFIVLRLIMSVVLNLVGFAKDRSIKLSINELINEEGEHYQEHVDEATQVTKVFDETVGFSTVPS